MNNLLDLYELIDISSLSEEAGEIKRASTLLPRNSQINPTKTYEISHLLVESTADEEESFELSLESKSLESDCKTFKLTESYKSFKTVESFQYPRSERTKK